VLLNLHGRPPFNEIRKDRVEEKESQEQNQEVRKDIEKFRI